MSATPSDHRSAAAIATGAGELLVGLRKLLDERDAHPGLRRAMGDKLAHDYIVGELARDHPDDAVLSEEGVDDVTRLSAERVWIVDPLDGTREFGQHGRTDWAVHIALVIDGAVAAAAVALPAHGLTFTAVPPPEPPARIAEGPPRLVVSRSRPPAAATAVAHRIDGVLLPLGSAGAKAMAVVLGEADIYAHSGGQYEWDSAAPVGVAAAAGLHVSRLDGSPLVYNRADPWLPDLLICRQEFVEDVLSITSRPRRA
jgi:3'(2'), 5'-bisphosphate nucleotidase